jgi:predicted nuclease of predicted toxin-antitoxin system
VKFLVDAQLPERLSRQLVDAGHDVLHTSQLADGNRTTDQEIVRLADEQDRVVVSKDRDFRDSHLLRGAPRRLLVVSTGNISNDDLLVLFNQHLTAVVAAFGKASLVELRSEELVVHDDE